MEMVLSAHILKNTTHHIPKKILAKETTFRRRASSRAAEGSLPFTFPETNRFLWETYEGMPTPVASAKVVGRGGGGGPKTVLITGVSRGLGRALALEMAKRGHLIIGCGRSQDKLDSLQSELNAFASSTSSSSSTESRHLLMNVDVRSNSGVEEFAQTLVEKKRVPNIIVNNAGTINKNNNIWDVSAEEFDSIIDTNVKGIANVLRHFIPLMNERKHGIIVNMSSGWGRSAAAKVAPYCASKWAIEGLTRAVAKELSGGVAIVAVSPGVIHTDMLESCFGSTASAYQSPQDWAPKAATMVLHLTTADNGASLTV